MTAKEAKELADAAQHSVWEKLPQWLTKGIETAALQGFYEARFSEDIWPFKRILEKHGYRLGNYAMLESNTSYRNYVSWDLEASK